jgi:pyruvate dehydrogenase E2 component (dihydrolipoamide acetyltransferase)
MGVFAMPSLGADMEAGKLVEWLVQPGDTVRRGDVVAVVETQKGAIEIEIFEEGTVHDLLAELGQKLPVGAPLALVLADGEAQPAAAAAEGEPAAGSALPRSAAEPAGAAELRAPSPARADPEPPPPFGPRASPAARQLAERLGVDLGALKGSGPGGAIQIADVEAAGPPSPSETGAPLEEMRKAIAAAMSRSKQTIPHFYLSQTLDVDPAFRFLEERNAGAPPQERIILGALFVRATALACAKVPVMNGHFDEAQGFLPSSSVNPGVAIALRGGGLVAPALTDAARMSLPEVMAGMRDLTTRARAGRLRASEMTGGTITVSSLGETGSETMTGVIFPPQVALVGLGAPHLRPWVVEGAVVPRRVVTLTVSADHRVSDGRQVARFIAEMATLIENPEEL